MNAFEKYFEERTVDGVCAVIFWPTKASFDEHTKERYILVYLYDATFSKTKCWFGIRKDKVPEKGKVVFKLPECMMGRVVGKGGVNIKKVAQALGGRYVTVQKV